MLQTAAAIGKERPCGPAGGHRDLAEEEITSLAHYKPPSSVRDEPVSRAGHTFKHALTQEWPTAASCWNGGGGCMHA